MYRALKALDPNYPIGEYLGDIGHPRAANKSGEVDYALERVFEWLDFHLKGLGTASPSCHDPAPQLRCDVLAALTRPPSVPFDAADVLRVDRMEDLATAFAKEEFAAPSVLTYDPANFGGVFFDPFIFSACEQLQPGCPAPLPDLIPVPQPAPVTQAPPPGPEPEPTKLLPVAPTGFAGPSGILPTEGQTVDRVQAVYAELTGQPAER